jgi:hypothetical protein
LAADGVLAPSRKIKQALPAYRHFFSTAIVHQSHSIGTFRYWELMGHYLKAIKDYGGITVQDEESAAYPAMPNSAVAGVVDFILSPDKMTEKLLEVTQIINIPTSIDQNLPLGDEEVFRQINASYP